MISKVEIKNFKSISSIDLSLKMFNVIIGENGSGKSNVLEAIAIASAAVESKLDNEFLSSRGIRTLNPTNITPAIEKSKKENTQITIAYNNPNSFNIDITTEIKHENNNRWDYTTYISINRFIEEFAKIKATYLVYSGKEREKALKELDVDPVQIENYKKIRSKKEQESRSNDSLSNYIKQLQKLKIPKESQVTMIKESIYDNIYDYESSNAANFLIFAPELSTLRIYEKESQILPIGINGEGLLKHVKEILLHEEKRNEIISFMRLIGWFKDFEIEEKLSQNLPYLFLKDKYATNPNFLLDQRTVNEGFLFLLFYCVLFISDDTPSFFAIDNIDNSLNPKLCTKLVKNLSSLALKYNKQVILTTHNPAVLDALDLSSDNQSLHVVYRDKQGQTSIKNVTSPQPLPNQEPMKLSEAFMKGFIGGLPKNF